MIVPPDPIRRRRFIRQRVAQEAPFPPQTRPLTPNGAMHLMGAGRGRPIDRSPLKVIVSPDAIRRRRFIRQRVAQEAPFPPQTRPPTPNGAMHLMGTGRRRPIDRPALKMVVPADAIRRRRLIRQRVTQEAPFPPQSRPSVTDESVDFMSSGCRRPIDGAASVMPVMADPVRGDEFGGRRRAQPTSGPSKSRILHINI